MELGRYDEAFAAFDSMVRLRPDAASYARVAYAHELQGRLDEALRHMQMATEATSAHDPESIAWHHVQVGGLLFQMGRIDDAARAFARANYAFPNHPYARAGLARRGCTRQLQPGARVVSHADVRGADARAGSNYRGLARATRRSTGSGGDARQGGIARA